MTEKMRAPRNRTVTLDDGDRVKLRSRLKIPSQVDSGTVDATVLGDCLGSDLINPIASDVFR